MSDNHGFGIDVGGSGIKGGVVDLDNGTLVGDRIKIKTPQPATPDAVAATIAEIVEIAGWEGPIGVTLPSVVRNQTALLAANIDKSWVNLDCAELFARHLPGRDVHVLNDADAAGMAEAAYGDERAKKGSVVLLTFGTGIGSALLHDGKLFPNTEFGHLEVDGKEAEHIASAAVRERKEMSYKKWTKKVSKVLNTYEDLLWPTLFIVGGGISRKHEKWVPLLETRTPVVPAKLQNQAGIVGAAMAVQQGLRP
ncbi:ROK family protein [Corynebacterium sp. TAE3-ERU12]|uniref:polyphosphate--glucose phosphotransferase n=1 Tax=Corynebacterium sp. TAE3-ERU12 TaxID=2849491 RepID=UPI001C479E38|nr:ROK family protein [Corynebacterium sp. TAE3-ERU12]MBV7295322.1 ROK family protein [Corynebacterium sp. TAE3-ERU12]